MSFLVQFRHKNSACLTHFSNTCYMPISLGFGTLIMFNVAHKLRSSSFLCSSVPLFPLSVSNLCYSLFRHIEIRPKNTCALYISPPAVANAKQLHLITYSHVSCVRIWIQICWPRFNHNSTLQDAVCTQICYVTLPIASSSVCSTATLSVAMLLSVMMTE